jgi:HEAT repeat protein
MQPERVVEIRQDGQSAGSGYLISARHVLTARHVLAPAVRGALCEVWPLGSVGDEALSLKQRKRPLPQPARVAWISTSSDVAVLKLTAASGVAGIQPELVAFGIVPDDGYSYRFIGSGLPEASGNDERRVWGTFNWVRPSLRFDVNVENGPPRDWRQWAGFSGTAIFSGDLLVGVVRTVDKNWNGGVLEATPVEHILQDRGFVAYLRRSRLPEPIARKLTRAGSPLVGIPAAQLSGRYRKLLAEQLSKLWIPGEQEPRLLEHVFVDLRLRAGPPPVPRAAWIGMMDATLRRRRNVLPELNADENETAGAPSDKAISIDDLTRRPMRAVILGAPGLGKSTLLRYIALKLVASSNRLPVFLELKRVSREAFERAGGSLTDLLYDRAFAAVVQPSAGEQEAIKGFFRDRLEAGEVAVLLDGLDEIRGKELLSDFANAVTEFMQSAYSANDFLISTRPYAFNSQFPGLAEIEIAPMSRVHTEKFLMHYYGTEPSLHNLMTPLLHRPELQELASNPGLLGLLVRLYARRSEIIGDRLELYREIANSLLTKLDAEKSVLRAFHIPDPDGFLKGDFLGHLAHEQLICKRGDDVGRLLFDGGVIRNQAARFCALRNLGTVESRLLADDVKATSLLRQLGSDGYAFAHLTVQEYLAAAELVRSKDCLGLFVRAYFDPAVAELEVLPMAIGLAANPDDYYSILEDLPDSLDLLNLRLRVRSLAYAQRIGGDHLRQIGDELATLIFDQSPYLRVIWRSLLGTTRRSADVIADRLADMLHCGRKEVRQVCATVLGYLGGDRAAGLLLESLKHDDDPGVRQRAGSWVPRIAGEHAIPHVINSLARENSLNSLPGEKSRFQYGAINGIAHIGGDRAMQALLGLLKNGDSHHRFYAACALGEMGAREALPDLLAALADKAGGQVREGAAIALDVLGDERSVPALLETLQNCSDDDLANRIAGALGRIGGERAQIGLIRILQTRTRTTIGRGWAAYALGRIGGPESIAPLQRALKDREETVRVLAAGALGVAAGADAMPDLLKILSDERETQFLRQKAAETLGELRDPRAIPILVAAIDDGESEIADSAAEALRRIGGQQVIQALLAQISGKGGDGRDARLLYWATELSDESGCLALSGALPRVYGPVDAWKPHDFARQRIIRAMAKAGDTQATAVLQAALRDANQLTRLWAAEGLGADGGSEASMVCLEALRNDLGNLSERDGVLRVAGEAAVPDLLASMKNAPFDRCWYAAKALKRIDAKSLAGGLLRALSQADEFVRHRAAEVVAYYCCDPDTVSEVSRLAASDPSEAVRNASAKAGDQLVRSQSVRRSPLTQPLH